MIIVTPQKKQDKTIEDLTKLAEDVASTHGLAVVCVNILHQGKRRVLNVTIHRKGSRVSLDDCETVSRQLEARLDQLSEDGDLAPVVGGQYHLQVESPGIDRTLKDDSDYDVFAGEIVELRLKEAIDNLPLNLKGILLGLETDRVRIKNPCPIAVKSKKGQSKSKNQADEKLLDEVLIPLSGLYSVRLYPDPALAKAPTVCLED